MKRVEVVWKELTEWFGQNAPELLETFRPGASEAEVTDLEAHIGLELPDDFRTFLQICNGQYGHEGFRHSRARFYSGDLMPIEDIKSDWSMMQDLLEKGTFTESTAYPGEGVKKMWWNPAWVPFLFWLSADNTVLDLDPTEGGTRGQVVIFWHDQGDRDVDQPSFTAWLEYIMDGIKSGEIVFDREEYNALMDIKDLG
jgi:cell wall assembly regulator SMI1